ncbi:permease family protein [Asticcacaulis biprosthecium C19]|uniref:Permease family protein n=1 Tax=Asticcacaulis biprosthecium C19 TaxID=715226 RepID=F4QIK0_9CAUL|nr:ABC transporter permease [Asticcacaulis biprosthecium]EGF92989.1 permease family protein [Asticcacaulis biprosthecium C19]
MTPLLSLLLYIFRTVVARWGVYLLMVAGLTLSYAAAIVVTLYVHDELTHDRFMAQADRVYMLTARYGPPDRGLVASDRTPAGMAKWMASDVAEIDQVARIVAIEWPMRSARRQVRERFYWADPNIFKILQLPAVEGDLATALKAPGSVVMTQRMARAYFGRPDAVGLTLTTKDNQPLTVTAILKDLPANTHLDREIFVSGRGSYSMLAVFDLNPDYQWNSAYIYATFKPGADVAAVEGRLQAISRSHWRGPNNLPEGYELIRLTDLHFHPHGDGEQRPRGHVGSILALVVVTAAILALAGINFSGLVLAETQERGDEMAIRKALGARRIDLIWQILREALWVNLVSVVLALAVVERLLPALNGGLDLDLHLWRHPAVFLGVLGATVVLVTVLSGLYPAFAVSRPAANTGTGRLSALRWRGWVVAQIALVVVLLIGSHTMNRQWQYATDDALNFNGDHVVMIRFSDFPNDDADFVAHLRDLKGVESVAESFGSPTMDNVRPAWIRRPGLPLISLTRNSAHPDFFKVFQVPLVAGRHLSGTFSVPEVPPEILINLSAVKALGFATPEAALGQEIVYETDRTTMRSRIVGVLPDLRFATVYEPKGPMIFDNFSKYLTVVNVRISPTDTAGTLARIDALWSRDNGGSMPMQRWFYRDYLLDQYHDLHQQMRVFNLVAGVAIILSTLGLTGLCIFLTRRQARDLAILRALGATFGDIFVQRLTPFFVPLLIANAIAWPAAWLVLRSWLGSFAEHIPLSAVSFLGAAVTSVVFALLTVAAHSALTAGKVSVSASLRHE